MTTLLLAALGVLLAIPTALLAHELRTRYVLRRKARRSGIDPPPFGRKRVGL